MNRECIAVVIYGFLCSDILVISLGSTEVYCSIECSDLIVQWYRFYVQLMDIGYVKFVHRHNVVRSRVRCEGDDL
jgi:hypothetical protein